MAVRKTGLGRGLDGLFPSYINNSDGKASEKDAGKTEKESSGKKAASKTSSKSSSAKGDKAEKAAKTDKSDKKDGSVKSGSKKNSAKSESKSASKSVSKEEVMTETKTAKEAAPKTEVNTVKETAPKVEAKAAKEAAPKTEEKAVKETAAVKKPEEKAESNNGVLMMRLSSVEPNREQPRKVFDEEALQELAESVKQYGIIQPIIVQKRDDYYEIIAGERRWRAAKLAGLKEVPVVVRDYTDREIMEVSLIENIQREDLNPIEEAKAYQRLMQEYELKQEEVASRVAKSRSAITNSMRLLKLDERVQQMLIDDKLSSGHARAILSITDTDKQYEIALKVCEMNLSVRDVEKLVKEIETPKPEKKKKPENTALKLILQEMETKMNSILGTKVTIHPTSEKKGKIEINYFSNAELERIYDLLREIPMQIDHISGEETV